MNLGRTLLQTRWLSGAQHTRQKFRMIYSPASLGVIEYQNVRDRYKNIMNPETLHSFRQKMIEASVDETNKHLVFSDDLKQMVHVVENDDDLTLLENLLAKFNKQNSKLRFDKFIFGPVIMRMYYHLDKPVEALNAYMNPELEGFFDQLTSHVLLLDLLFRNQMYDEVVKIYQITREKQYSFGKYSKTIIVPVFGALYKLNTEVSYKYMLDLLQEMREANHVPVRRAMCFGAALALRQNNPQLALELLSSISNQGFFLVRSIKVLATCSLNQIDETLIILASVLTIDTPVKTKHTFPADVVANVKNHVEKLGRKDHIIEFRRLEKQLKDFGHITRETLDDLLSEECTIYNPVNKMKKVINASIDEISDDNRRYKKTSRPGLLEML